MPFDAPFELEPVSSESSFIPADVAELISRAASGKPDVQELQASIMTLQSQRKALTMQQFTPFLRLGWTLSSMFNPALDPFRENWFNGDNWTSKGQAGGSFSITLGMNFNGLFGFTKEGQQRKDMESGIQIQNIILAQKIRESELEIFTKINSLEKTRTTKEVQQAAVDLAEQSYKLTEEAYRAGLQDFQAVQNAALALDQAKLYLLREQFNYLNDLIDLEYSIGVPFGTLSLR
jgi:outer membrane protein TolC